VQHSPLHGDLVAVGRILRAVGLDGLCGVEAFGEFLQQVETPLQVWTGEDENSTSPALIEKIAFRPGNAVCSFQNVNDRDSAQLLRDRLIFVEARLLPELRQDDFYSFELEGMAVHSEDELIGYVRETHHYPTADALEITGTNGARVMIPMVGDAIVRIDKEQRRITVRKAFLEEML